MLFVFVQVLHVPVGVGQCGWLCIEVNLYACVYVRAYWEHKLLAGPRGRKLWQPCCVDVIFGSSLTIYVKNII